jgi:hypothetical protein
MLRTLLAGSKIAIKGFGEDCERSDKFRGELVIGKLISGLADNTSDCWWPQRDLAVGRVPDRAI